MNKLQAISLTIFTLMQFTSLSTRGQIVNIEKFRIDKDTSGVWFGNIGVRFNFEKQKSDILSFQINSNVVYLSELHSYIMINKVNFIKVSGTQVISEVYIHLRANFLRRKVLSIEPFAQYQYDQNRGLDARFISGAGLRYNIHTTETLNIAFNTGVMYEYERWTDTIETN